MTILFQVDSVEIAVILILSQVQYSPPIINPVHSIDIDYYGIRYDTGFLRNGNLAFYLLII